MSKKEKTSRLSSPWAIGGIVTTIIGAFFVALFSQIPIISTIKFLSQLFWECAKFILGYEVTVGWVLIVLIVLMGIIGIGVFLYWYFKQEPFVPDYPDYTSDTFFDWKWSWLLNWNSVSYKLEIIDIYAHCPECKAEMNSEGGHLYKCSSCEFEGFGYTLDKIESEIKKRLNRKIRALKR